MTLHERLIQRQSKAELERKQRKAARRGIWTQEDMDLADVEADELWRSIHWRDAAPAA